MKKIMTITIAICLVFALSVQALADYTIGPPEGPDYGEPTSVEPVYTVDRGEQPNEYKGKDAVMIPPAFGTGGIYPLNAFGNTTVASPSGAVIGGGSVTYPDAVESAADNYPSAGQAATSSPASYFTEVTSDLK